MQQRSGAEFQQVGVCVPAGHHIVHVERAAATNGDQTPGQQERRDPRRAQAGFVRLDRGIRAGREVRRVDGEESVRRVARSFGAFAARERIFHRMRVEAQLLRQREQPLRFRIEKIHPHETVGVLQVVRDVGEREVFTLDFSAPPHPCADLPVVDGGHSRSLPDSLPVCAGSSACSRTRSSREMAGRVSLCGTGPAVTFGCRHPRRRPVGAFRREKPRRRWATRRAGCRCAPCPATTRAPQPRAGRRR